MWTHTALVLLLSSLTAYVYAAASPASVPEPEDGAVVNATSAAAMPSTAPQASMLDASITYTFPTPKMPIPVSSDRSMALSRASETSAALNGTSAATMVSTAASSASSLASITTPLSATTIGTPPTTSVTVQSISPTMAATSPSSSSQASSPATTSTSSSTNASDQPHVPNPAQVLCAWIIAHFFLL